jgi:hypothetical protein
MIARVVQEVSSLVCSCYMSYAGRGGQLMPQRPILAGRHGAYLMPSIRTLHPLPAPCDVAHRHRAIALALAERHELCFDD